LHRFEIKNPVLQDLFYSAIGPYYGITLKKKYLDIYVKVKIRLGENVLLGGFF